MSDPEQRADVLPVSAAEPKLDRAGLWRITLLISAACLVPALLDGWQRAMQATLAGEPQPPWQRLVFGAGEWVLLGMLIPLVYAFAVRFPLRPPRIARDIAMHVVGAALLCLAWGLLGTAMQAAFGLIPASPPLISFAVSWVLICLPTAVVVYFSILGSLLAVAYFSEARQREAQAERLAKQVAEARLGALRMQLHPHFLFNSLNSIAVLIRDRRNEDAAEVTEQLSEMLRDVLSEANVAEVPLSAEIAFLNRYLSIEQVRFPDRLEVRWIVTAESERGMVPSFVLQPLVENAIRHGVAARRESSRVDVETKVDRDELVLSVSNDLPAVESGPPAPGRGVGVSNTQARLAALYGERGTLALERSSGRMLATVRLPFRDGALPA